MHTKYLTYILNSNHIDNITHTLKRTSYKNHNTLNFAHKYITNQAYAENKFYTNYKIYLLKNQDYNYYNHKYLYTYLTYKYCSFKFNTKWTTHSKI